MISSTAVPAGWGQGYNLPASTSGSYIPPATVSGWHGNYIGQRPSYEVGNYIPPATVSNITSNYVSPASGLNLYGAPKDLAPSPDTEVGSIVGSAVSGVASGLSWLFGSSKPDRDADDVERLKARVRYLEQKLSNYEQPPLAITYGLSPPSYTSGAYGLSPSYPPMIASASSPSLLGAPIGYSSPIHSPRFSHPSFNGNASPVAPSMTFASRHMQWNPPEIDDNKPRMVASASSPTLLAAPVGYSSSGHSPRLLPASFNGDASPVAPSTQYSIQWNPPEIERETRAKLPEQPVETQVTSVPQVDDFDARVKALIKEVLKDRNVQVVPPFEMKANVERVFSGRAERLSSGHSGSTRAPSPRSKIYSPKRRSATNLSAKDVA